LNVSRSSRVVAPVLFLLAAAGASGVGCSLIVDFDSTKIGGDASVAVDASDGAIDSASEAAPDSASEAAPDAPAEAADTGCGGPTDCPAPSSDCVSRTCNAGVCGTANVAADTACTSSSGKFCDGNGNCVACNAPAQCPAPTTACRTAATCTGHVCGFTNAAKGTACTDGGGVVCDGNGTCVAAHCTDGVKDADETDLDCGGATCGKCAIDKGCNSATDCVDATTGCAGGSFTAANTCTGNKCTAHVTVCSGSTSKCDATAGCVQCNAPTDCPAGANECSTATCNAHACGFDNASSTTVLASQTAGDCHIKECDGAGGIVNLVDMSDPPTSTTLCKINPGCDASGNPTFDNATAGTDCTADGVAGKTVCGDGAAAGTCVACNDDSKCTSPATCQSHVCL
jgi:hypothetical protein